MTPQDVEIDRLERKAEHLRERHDRMADLLSTVNVRLHLADSWSWHTESGARLRIAEISGHFGVDLDDEPLGVYDTQDQAFAAAVATAPPSDPWAAEIIARAVYSTT